MKKSWPCAALADVAYAAVLKIRSSYAGRAVAHREKEDAIAGPFLACHGAFEIVRQELPFYWPKTFLNLSIVSGRCDIISFANVSISSPDVYSASSFLFFTSSKKTGSFNVF